MLIILEGVDGSGKSTLAQTIADQISTAYPADKVELWHAGPPTPGASPIDLYARPLWHYQPGTGHHIIADRHHIGEWIYPGVLGRDTTADLPTWRYLDLFLQSKGAVLVHATPPVKDIVANVQKRGDDLIKIRQLQGIHAAYIAMIQSSRLPKIRYAALGNPFIPGETIRLARYMEAKVAPLAKFITYVGPAQPTFLLLGDVRHNLRGTAQDLIPELTRDYGPAFGPYPGTSGHFLLQHLPFSVVGARSGYAEPARQGIGLANACDVDNAAALWEALGRPVTVALGQNAARCATWAHVRVEHPQYIKRFKNGTGAAYGSRIADMLGL